jgi:hypothetical protein
MDERARTIDHQSDSPSLSGKFTDLHHLKLSRGLRKAIWIFGIIPHHILEPGSAKVIKLKRD